MNPDRAARLHGAVDRDRGEAFRLVPMLPATAGRMQPVTDPGRAPVDFMGTWSGSPQLVAFEAARSHAVSRGQKPGHQGQEIAVLVRQDAFPVRPRDQDRVTRLGDGARFTISRIAETGFGRFILVLSR